MELRRQNWEAAKRARGVIKEAYNSTTSSAIATPRLTTSMNS